MNANVFSLKKLFFFCLGLFIASAFCMKWIESEFISNGKPFSIMDLELYLGKEDLIKLLKSFDDKTATVVSYHLHFDFAFMAGVFPGIAILCILVREKVDNNLIRSLLFIFALLQFVAWGFDIYENVHLLDWLGHQSPIMDIELFHLLVRLKFIFSFGGVLMALIGFLFFRKKSTNIAVQTIN
jgi:hypothetical protein